MAVKIHKRIFLLNGNDTLTILTFKVSHTKEWEIPLVTGFKENCCLYLKHATIKKSINYKEVRFGGWRRDTLRIFLHF